MSKMSKMVKDAKATKNAPPATVPNTTLTIHEQVMARNDCNLNANDISVRTEESKIFTFGGIASKNNYQQKT
jgi:hypothetical protein